ncbi:MAG: hypothetical protein ACRED9_07675 [Caulobacteraceae bacterium]
MSAAHALAEPERERSLRARLLTPLFWSLIIFSALCIGAGAAVGLIIGPHLLPPTAHQAIPTTRMRVP